MAETNNYLIGRTGLDIDMKRVGDILGFNKKEDIRTLRDLKSGEFYTFGAAFNHTGIEKTMIGDVLTTHARSSGSILKPIKTPPNIKKVLKNLIDMPKEVEEELRTTSEFKNKIRELKTKLTIAERAKPAIDLGAIEKAKITAFQHGVRSTEKQTQVYEKKLSDIGRIIGQKVAVVKTIIPNKLLGRPVSNMIIDDPIPENIKPLDDKPLTGGALRMLKVLVSRHPMVLTKAQMATFSKLSPRSGTFGTYLSLLKSRNFIIVNGNEYSASEEGIDYLGDTPNPPQTTEDVIEMWRNILNGGAKRMFNVLVERHPNTLIREDLGELTELSASSGTFGTYLSMLRSNGLIEVDNEGIKLSESLFI